MDQAIHGRASEVAVEHKIARLAATQHGVFSRVQALEAGASRSFVDWRVATSKWDPLYSGVYRVTGTPETWRQRLLAACLVAGAGAAASHRSAGALGRLPGVPEGTLEISVRKGRRVRRAGLIVHQAGGLSALDLTVVDAIPCTNMTRTLIDLSAVLSADLLEEALDDALRRRLTTLRRLRWRLKDLGRGGRPGVKTLGKLIEARTGSEAIPESVLETRFFRLLTRAGLPIPACQHEIEADGRLIARVDFAYLDGRLAIEADGYRWHSSRARWSHDLARRNRLTALGWRVIHVTWSDIEERPDAVLRMIAEALVRPTTRTDRKG